MTTNRAEFEEYIVSSFGIEPEHPWESHPSYTVFRHIGNRKWFAVIMDIPKQVLGIKEEGIISAVNLKCDFVVMSSLKGQGGVFPGYHMNKNHWITVALDGSVEAPMLKWLLDISFELTSGHKKQKAKIKE